jgi:hypothetical protein
MVTDSAAAASPVKVETERNKWQHQRGSRFSGIDLELEALPLFVNETGWMTEASDGWPDPVDLRKRVMRRACRAAGCRPPSWR